MDKQIKNLQKQLEKRIGPTNNGMKQTMRFITSTGPNITNILYEIN